MCSIEVALYHQGGKLELIRDHFESLSPRQREVALLLADGLTNADIGLCLGMTVHTVKAHRAEVMRRMNAYTFADLVKKILSLKLTKSALEEVGSRSIRVIVVEDDPWYRDYLTDNLNEHGFITTGVADGEEFSKAWAETAADIVILDVDLGANREDGITIASNLVESNKCGVIMVTARGEREDRMKGLTVGADAYFAKPVNINELILTLTNLWRRLNRPIAT